METMKDLKLGVRDFTTVKRNIKIKKIQKIGLSFPIIQLKR